MGTCKTIGLILFILLTLPIIALAADENTGTYAAPFLNIGVSARATAMGEAQVATTNDSSSIYWNPAGLVRIEKGDLTFTHNEWLVDTRYEFFSIGYSLGRLGTFGGGLSYLSYGDIAGYDEMGNPTGIFSAKDMAVYLSYARSLFTDIHVGANFKYIQQKIGSESGSAYAGDLGVLYDTPLKGLCVGFSGANMGTELKFINESAKLPIVMRGGFAYTLPIPGENFSLLAAFDLVKPQGNRLQYNLGTELTVINTILIRLGYKGNTDLEEYSTGVGVSHDLGGIGLRVDYSYSTISEADFGDAHRITLGLGF